jgi:hypothetical protein
MQPALAGTPTSPDEGDERRVPRIFLVAALLHALAYFCAVAPWMGEDEPWHLEYASFVAEGERPWGTARQLQMEDLRSASPSVLQTYRRFPGLTYDEIAARERAILAAMAEQHYFRRVDWAGASPERGDFDEVQPYFSAASQPPGYYALLGAWLALGPDGTPGSALLWGRALSLLLYLVAAWAAWRFAQAAFADRWVALAAAVSIAWFPMSVRQAAVVNNDVLVRTLGALVLAWCARKLAGEPGWRPWILAAAAVLAALTVKATAVSLVGALILALFLSTRNLARLAGIAALAGAVVALVLWILHVQHSPVIPRNVTALLQRIERGGSLPNLVDVWTTLIGGFNWLSRELPRPFYLATALVAGLALASALVAVFRRPSGVSRPVLILCLAVVAMQLGLIVLRGEGHGRYLMPVLPALGMVFVTGLLAQLHRYWRPRVAVLYVLALIAYDALFLWGGLVPNEYAVWGS